MQEQRLKLILDSVIRLARRGAMSNAVNLLTKLRPVDIAQILSQLPQSEREAIFNALVGSDLTKAAEAVSEIDTESAVTLLTALTCRACCKSCLRTTPRCSWPRCPKTCATSCSKP